MATGRHVEAPAGTLEVPANTQGPWGHVTVTVGMCAGRKGTYRAITGDS